MKKQFRWIALLVACLMLLPVFAACKDSGNTSTGTTAGEKNTTAPPPESTTAKSDDKPTPEKATEIRTSMQLAMVAEALNADPESSRGKTYILKANIDMAGEWTGRFSVSSDGKMSKPGSVTEWKPITKFYGTFDGNGKTITGLFADGKAADGAAMFGELCDGAVVKNLTVDRSFFASKGGAVAGLAQATSGNVTIENVTVNTYLFTQEGALAGLIGKAGGALTVKDSTFAGVLGVLDADGTLPAEKTDVVIGQMIADGGEQTLTLENCTVRGLIYSKGEAKDWCAVGSGKLTQNGGKVEASKLEFGEDAILIYTAEDLLRVMSDLKNASWGGDDAVNKNPETYEGKTIKLMNDIDLNPGWSAASTITPLGTGSTADDPAGYQVAFPEAPANKWMPMMTFKGTFDGQGYTIKGLYINYWADVTTKDCTEDTIDAIAGFVCRNFGLIKNVVFQNGLIVLHDKNESGKPKIGSVAGVCQENGSVENIYSDMELWAGNKVKWNNVGGIVGRFDGEGTFASVKNCVFTGKIGSLDGGESNEGPSSVSTFVGGIVGSGQAKEGLIQNCLSLGSLLQKKKDGSMKGNTQKVGNQLTNVTQTNNLTEKKDAAFLESEAGKAYAEDWEYNDTLGFVVPKTISAMFQ